MVEISSYGSGEGLGEGNRPAYPTTLFCRVASGSDLRGTCGEGCLEQQHARRRPALREKALGVAPNALRYTYVSSWQQVASGDAYSEGPS